MIVQNVDIVFFLLKFLDTCQSNQKLITITLGKLEPLTVTVDDEVGWEILVIIYAENQKPQGHSYPV